MLEQDSYFWVDFVLYAVTFITATGAHSITNKKYLPYHIALWICQIISVTCLAACTYNRELSSFLLRPAFGSAILVLVITNIHYYMKGATSGLSEWTAQRARINKWLLIASSIVIVAAITVGIQGENGVNDLRKVAAKNRVDITQIKKTADDAKANSDSILVILKEMRKEKEEKDKKEEIKLETSKDIYRKKLVKTKNIKKPEPTIKKDEKTEKKDKGFFLFRWLKGNKNT